MSNLTVELKITMDSQLMQLLTGILGSFVKHQPSEELKRTEKKETKQVKEEPKKEVKETVKEETKEDVKEDVKQEEKQEITIEMLRAKGAELAQAGKQSELKAAFAECGAAKLSEVKPEKYKQLYQLMEGI